MALRGNSPASSTGDSSSGRTPITPVDGGEIRTASAARKRGHRKSSSAAFDEVSRGRLALREQERTETSDPEESRRRERRRSEAKAAIEVSLLYWNCKRDSRSGTDPDLYTAPPFPAREDRQRARPDRDR